MYILNSKEIEMKKANLLLITLLTQMLMLSPSTFADQNVPHQTERQDMPGSDKHLYYNNEESEMLYKKESKELNKMSDQVQLMEDQMKEIHAEKDPEKRRALMDEHKKTMHQVMNMMNNSNYTKHQLGRHTHKMSPKRRADVMEKHMIMMQKTMNQMMQRQDIPHQTLRQDMPGSDKHLKSKSMH
tara:strand:+ start:129 stop:683 length:555 start_codon:yes stop_codon:yes gene_type:complete